MSLLGPQYYVVNKGVSGTTSAQIQTQWTNFRTKYPAVSGLKRTLIVMGGTNDKSTLTGSQIWANLSPIFDQAATDLWDKLISLRITPFGSASGWTSGQQSVCDGVWTLQQAYTTTVPYATYDTVALVGDGLTGANHPALATSPVDYKTTFDAVSDGLHPNDNWASAIAAALKPLIA